MKEIRYEVLDRDGMDFAVRTSEREAIDEAKFCDADYPEDAPHKVIKITTIREQVYPS